MFPQLAHEYDFAKNQIQTYISITNCRYISETGLWPSWAAVTDGVKAADVIRERGATGVAVNKAAAHGVGPSLLALSIGNSRYVLRVS